MSSTGAGRPAANRCIAAALQCGPSIRRRLASRSPARTAAPIGAATRCRRRRSQPPPRSVASRVEEEAACAMARAMVVVVATAPMEAAAALLGVRRARRRTATRAANRAAACPSLATATAASFAPSVRSCAKAATRRACIHIILLRSRSGRLPQNGRSRRAVRLRRRQRPISRAAAAAMAVMEMVAVFKTCVRTRGLTAVWSMPCPNSSSSSSPTLVRRSPHCSTGRLHRRTTIYCSRSHRASTRCPAGTTSRPHPRHGRHMTGRSEEAAARTTSRRTAIPQTRLYRIRQ